MAGLIEEGEEVITEGKTKDDASADLALIGAAQRVEHYEIAGYTTAKNLAQQIRKAEIAQLLTKSLGGKKMLISRPSGAISDLNRQDGHDRCPRAGSRGDLPS